MKTYYLKKFRKKYTWEIINRQIFLKSVDGGIVGVYTDCSTAVSDMVAEVYGFGRACNYLEKKMKIVDRNIFKIRMETEKLRHQNRILAHLNKQS